MEYQGSQSDSYLEILHFSSTNRISRKMATQWVKRKKNTQRHKTLNKKQQKPDWGQGEREH